MPRSSPRSRSAFWAPNLRRVIAFGVAGACAAAFAITATTPAGAATTQTASCVDGGGVRWSAKAIWGGTYSSGGVRKVAIDYAGWTANRAGALPTNSWVRSYDGTGRQLKTLTWTGSFDYASGTAYKSRDPRNPTSAPGAAKVTVTLGVDGDGFGNCTMTFTQPGDTAPSPGSSAAPTSTPTSTAPSQSPTSTATSTAPSKSPTSTATSTASSQSPTATSTGNLNLPPGVPAGTNLTTQNGGMTINSAGTIVENKLVNGCITVNAANVIIRKSKVFCSGTAIQNNSTGLLVEDSEISCKDALGGTALTWQNFTARRVNAYGCENIIWAENNVLIEDSYIHDPIDYDPARDPHTDAIQVPRGATNITIRRNTIYGNYVNQNSFGNSAITTGAGTVNILITENLLAGGGYTVYCNQSGPGDNFRITNNRFSRIFVSTVGGFGPWMECRDETQVTGNVYQDTGRAL
jgi:hypothetical protein